MKTLNTFFTLLMFVCFSTMMYGQGDMCSTAQNIALTSGTTITLTGDGPATGAGCFNCGTATNADWFEFTAPGYGTIDIVVCNDPDDPDTRVWMYDGGCGSLNQVANDDDGCTGTYESQLLAVPVCANTTYHLEFDDRWSNLDYDFEVTYTQDANPPCLAPTVSVAGIGLDTVSLALGSCVGNATHNTIEYGVAGFMPGSGTSMTAPAAPSVTISGLANNTAYDFYVTDSCGVTGMSMTTGPISATTQNPCADPTNVNTDVVTTNSATISYVSSLPTPTGLAQIEFSTAPFAAGSGPVALTVTNDTFTLSGLTEVTTYYYYIREVCSVSPPTFSNWQGPFSFTTPFSGVAFYDFETANPGNAGGIFYNGWSAPTGTGSPDWEVENSTGANENSTNTGPFYDNTSFGTAGGHYMYLETSGGTVGNVDSMTSPMIDLTGYPNPYLNFYLHMFGSSMGTLDVQISDNLGASWSTIFSISGQQTSAGGDPWTPITLDISAYTGNVQVRFVGEKGAPAPGTTQNYRGDMSIDDVSVGLPITTPFVIPTCPDKPTSLAAFNITSTTADVSFALGNSANTAFEVEYGPAGFALGTGTIVAGTGFPPVNLTNLMPGTAYDAYARDICDPATNDASPWSDPVSFTTLIICNPVTTFPLVEDFESFIPVAFPFGCQTIDNISPSCWANDINNSNNWLAETGSTGTGYIGSDHTTGTGNYAYLEASSCGNTTSSLISPELDLSAGLGGDTAVVFWYYREPDNFNANDGSFEVYASTDNGATWSAAPIFSIPQDQGTDQWEKASFSIGAYDGMSSIRLRFDGQTGNSRDVAIDDIQIGVPAPSCPVPTDLGALAGLTTAQLFWTSGGSFLHNVVITPAGAGVGFPLLVLRGVTDEFVDVQQPIFMPNTSYDFYVQDSCLVDGIASPYAGPFTFTTINPACNVVAPYTEDFDAATLNPCWIQDPSDDEDWTVDAAGTGSPGTGPSGDTTTPAGTGNYIYYETSSPVAPGDEALLITPNIDVSALTTPELEFFYHMWDDGTGQMGDLEVYIESPATSGNWNLGLTISGNQGNQWNVANLDLLPYLADSTVRAAFLGIRGPGFRGDISLDEVSFQDGTACPVASNVIIDNITTTSATVSWVGSGASYDVEYGVENFVPGTGAGTVISGVTTGTANLTGLMADVEYEVYITNDCGAGVTATTDPTAFHSDCGGKPGDSFMDPIMVMSLPYADTNRTDRCYTNAIANANGYAAPDVVYEVTTGSMLCQTLTASMCGPLSNYDGYIYIYDEDGVELATGDDDCGIGGGPGEIVDLAVAANTTYYVVVSGWEASQGSYELSITSGMRSITANVSGVDATTIGGSDGMATVAGADGLSPYSYIWETGETADTIMGLMAGTYTVIVTDALGCTTSANAVVGEPCPADLDLTVNTFPSDTAYGSIVVTANQGSAPYTYSWSSGANTSLVTVPGQATYTVTVTDANGCTDSTTAQLLGVTTNQIESVVEYNLFPNPAVNQTQLQIGFGTATDVTLEVVTVDGKVLFNELRTNVSNTTFDIDTEDYAAGVYMVKVTADNQTMTRRLVVMKP